MSDSAQSQESQLDVERLKVLLDSAMERCSEEASKNIEMNAEIKLLRQHVQALKLALTSASEKISELTTGVGDKAAEAKKE